MTSSIMNRAEETPYQDVAILAHELREPLASILLATQIASEPTQDEFANREMLGLIQRQVRHAARIIDDVLDASRAAHGKLVLRKQLCDLNLAIRDAVETTVPLLKKRRHRFSIAAPASKVYLLADPVRVQQIVCNLLSNAAKYTEPGGMIRLSVETKEDSAVIIVRDNGIGISRDLLPRVFDLFQQGDGRIHQEFPGLGIGLALVKSLVDLHGGNVTAYSNGERMGSAFVVRLPGVRGGRDEPPGFLQDGGNSSSFSAMRTSSASD
jgi:signal transduction histidine kinase